MTSPPTIWLTGLSQAGKTTLADGLAQWFSSQAIDSQVLDGRAVRDDIGDFLGYSRDERAKVGRIMCSMAKLLNSNGVTVIATSITPYQESRDRNRASLANYFEIYLACDVDTCIERDQHNNYARALRGDLKHFIGVDDPFEVPKNPDLVVNTGELDADAALEQAKSALQHLVAP